MEAATLADAEDERHRLGAAEFLAPLGAPVFLFSAIANEA